MDLIVYPKRIEGRIKAIESKAHAHRVLIASALASELGTNKKTLVRINHYSQDIEATISCLEALGAGFEKTLEGLWITPIKKPTEGASLNCQESGSSLRFILPLAASLVNSFNVKGSGKLPQRPLKELQREMSKKGSSFFPQTLPFKVEGRLEAGRFRLPGNVTSQYISGLLFALPLLSKNSCIEIEGDLESAGYVDMTLAVLEDFSIEIRRAEGKFKIKGNQQYISPGEVAIEGDWSNSAFFMGMGALGGDVLLSGLDKNSKQPDKAFLDLLKNMGAGLEEGKEGIRIFSKELKGIKADISSSPDLMPILSVLMAGAKGSSLIKGGKRLRLKESDRLEAMEKNLRELGVNLEVEGDDLYIKGGSILKGGAVDSFMDHRIVMALTSCASLCKGPILITGSEAVEKSYPNFFEDYKALGGDYNVI